MLIQTHLYGYKDGPKKNEQQLCDVSQFKVVFHVTFAVEIYIQANFNCFWEYLNLLRSL